MSVREWINTAKASLCQRLLTKHSVYNVLFLLALLSSLAYHAVEGCTSQVFKLLAEDHYLGNSLIYEREMENVLDCAHLCLSENPQCKSINFEKGDKQHYKRKKCQLNNETKSTKPKELVSDTAFNYFEPIQQSVIQGVNQGNYEIQGASCADVYNKGTRADGVYTIDPDGLGAFKVSCDMTTFGGGWTVFQRRMDGSVEFYLGWDSYKKGFGDLNGEFWLSLDKIHRLSKGGQNVLRVDLEDFENETRYANYSTFEVANEADKYKLTVDGYSGNAGNALNYHNGMKFSTKDEDNDENGAGSCAIGHKGAWWYLACTDSNLNGLYLRGNHTTYANGLAWYQWKGPYYSLKKTEMKIRPRSFKNN